MVYWLLVLLMVRDLDGDRQPSRKTTLPKRMILGYSPIRSVSRPVYSGWVMVHLPIIFRIVFVPVRFREKYRSPSRFLRSVLPIIMIIRVIYISILMIYPLAHGSVPEILATAEV